MSTLPVLKPRNLFPTMFDEFFKPWNEWFGNEPLFNRPITVPAVNITENKDEYKVTLAAPGMKKDDFKIDIDGNLLVISAEKEETKEEKEEERYTRKEYNYSSFSRSFTLPDEIIPEKIEATYENGVLNLMLPKKEEAKKAIPKHIEIK